jgi:plastocyanin
MKKALTLSALFALASLSLAACGGGGDNGSALSTPTTTPTTAPATTATTGGGGGTTLQLAADPSALKFDTTSLSAKAGAVTLEFTNPSAIGHDVTIEAAGDKEIAKTDVISQSKTTLTANLKAGSYAFYCTVPGHEQAGMKGTLKVI